jgi:hypothetical protein
MLWTRRCKQIIFTNIIEQIFYWKKRMVRWWKERQKLSILGDVSFQFSLFIREAYIMDRHYLNCITLLVNQSIT